MVKEGSTVRVRRRALQNVGKRQSRSCGGRPGPHLGRRERRILTRMPRSLQFACSQLVAYTNRSPQCPGGLKLYVPSQYQRFVFGLYVTMTLASKPLNCPVPPENVKTPERVAN